METSKEDYLRSIYELYESDKECIKSVDIAGKLGVSKSSVSQMLKKFNNDKIIKTSPYSRISLTKKGLKEAIIIVNKHRVIEVFLKKILKYDLKKVHGEAHRLEHAFSNESIKRLNNFLKNPKKSPHGKKIPK